MKKNKTLRLASCLLIATLCSTCVISGTFAKYTSSASGDDSARVAKWAFTLTEEADSTFAAIYETGNETVDAADDKDVVAPGTSGSATFTVTGAPEVDYIISFEATGIKDISLPAGTYDEVVIDQAYYPIVYTVAVATINGEKTGSDFAASYNTLSAALTALQGVTYTFDANEACDVVVTIGWSWSFEDNGIANKDVLDTALGLATSGNLEVAYTLKVTSTQID